MSERVTLNELVRENANGRLLGQLAMPSFETARETHIGVCKELVALSDKWGGFPMTCLVYFAIGKEAHKKNALAKGYKKINSKKANTIIKWMALVAKYEKQKGYARNANVAHVLSKYYDKVSSKTADFTASLKNSEPIGKLDKAALFKTLCEALKIPTKSVSVSE